MLEAKHVRQRSFENVTPSIQFDFKAMDTERGAFIGGSVVTVNQTAKLGFLKLTEHRHTRQSFEFETCFDSKWVFARTAMIMQSHVVSAQRLLGHATALPLKFVQN